MRTYLVSWLGTTPDGDTVRTTLKVRATSREAAEALVRSSICGIKVEVL